jgi:hypothetical protein
VRVVALDEDGRVLPDAHFETERGPPPMSRIGVRSRPSGTRSFVVPIDADDFAVRVSAEGRDSAEAVLDFRTGELERELRLTLPRSSGLPGRISIRLDGFVPERTLAQLYSPAGFFIGGDIGDSKPSSLVVEARPGAYRIEIIPDPVGCVVDTTTRWYLATPPLRDPIDVRIDSDRETPLAISFEEGGRFRLHLRCRRSDPSAPDERGYLQCFDLDTGGAPEPLGLSKGDDFVGSAFTSDDAARWTTHDALRVGRRRFRIEAPGYGPAEFETDVVAGKYADVERELSEH